MTSRPLTVGERTIAASVFGTAINYDAVRIHQRKYWWFQPRHVTMAPDGHLWFHPHADHYCDDFCTHHSLLLRGHFIHEMTHIWQAQQKGRWYLPLMRHPFCRYDYVLEPGKPFAAYGIEQQAEIVRHVYLMRQGATIEGRPPISAYEAILPFQPIG
ncbi:MAG: vgr related protein [Sphingobium sp.]|nr:vgr related protein [Sphingobium sp.]